MGIRQALALLRKKRVTFRGVRCGRQVLLSTRTPIYVDVMSSFFNLFASHNAKPEVASALLARAFRSLSNVTFVFDGERTVQKMTCTEARQEAQTRAVEKVEELAKIVADTTTRSSIKNYNKKRKSLRLVKPGFIDAVIQALKKKSFNVEKATGEADVHIASKDGPFLVLTGDSDFLFHKSTTKIAFSPKIVGKNEVRFEMVDKADILQKLGLSQNQLAALAICSSNDYNRGEKTESIDKVYDFIANNTRGVDDIISVVSRYTLSKGWGVCFLHSISVFDSLHEDLAITTPCKEMQQRLEALRNSRVAMLQRLEECKQRVDAAWKAREKPALDPSRMHMSRFASPNPFRPLEWDDEKLRYSFKNIAYRPGDQVKSSGEAKKPKKKKNERKGPKEGEGKKEGEGSAAPEDKVKKSKKESKSSVQIAGFSVAARGPATPVPSDKPKQQRCQTEGNDRYNKLKKKHDFRTWQIGTLDSRTCDADEVAVYVREKIKWLVGYMHEAKMKAARFTAYMMELLFNVDAILAANSRITRKRESISEFPEFWRKLKPPHQHLDKRLWFAAKVVAALIHFSLGDILFRVLRSEKEGVGGRDYWERLVQLVATGGLNNSDNKVPLLCMMEDHPDLEFSWSRRRALLIIRALIKMWAPCSTGSLRAR